MDIRLKNVRVNPDLSEETPCFSATIYINGRKAGTVKNDGHGGGHIYYFKDRRLEAAFHQFCVGLPPHQCADGESLPMCADLHISLLVEKADELKFLRRYCRVGTLYRLKGDPPGEWRRMEATFNSRIEQHLRRHYGGLLDRIGNQELAEAGEENSDV